MGDRNHRHLSYHDLAFCRGGRALSADGGAEGLGRRPAGLAGNNPRPFEVLSDSHRGVRHRFRGGHLVCHRPGPSRGHQHVDSQLRLWLGHRVGLFHSTHVAAYP